MVTTLMIQPKWLISSTVTLLYRWGIIALNIDKLIPRTRKSPTDYLKNRNADSMFLSPVTQQEIEFIIQNLNSQKQLVPVAFQYSF